MNDLYPVYIILFSDDTEIGRIIQKATGSEYSHATIALDPTMNNMYSFADIPYTYGHVTTSGFMRESIWSPKYKKNIFFTVLVTFVSKKDYDIIQSKINYFCINYKKFKYNDIGIIQYYLNFKETKGVNEEKKKHWFCSEFVSFMCKSGNIKGFDNIMMAPSDIKTIKNPNVINLGNYTIANFKESELIMKTEEARKEFIKNQQTTIVSESFYFDYIDILKEVSLKDIIKRKKKEFKESDIISYTAFIDWKYLYDQFVQLFPETDHTIRFDLYELIVRKMLVPFKRSTENATQEIYNEVKNIYRIIGNNVIKAVNKFKGIIYVDKKGKNVSYKYPTLTTTNESFSNIEEEKYFFE